MPKIFDLKRKCASGVRASRSIAEGKTDEVARRGREAQSILLLGVSVNIVVYGTSFSASAFLDHRELFQHSQSG